MSLVEYLDEITNAPSMEALWDLHCRKMAEYGFDRLFYGYTNYRLGKSLGDPDDFIILTNHSKDYTDWFLGQSMYFHAPMVKWALENEGWTSWGMVADMFTAGVLTQNEMKVVEFNQKMKVTTGYTVSFKSVSPRSKGGNWSDRFNWPDAGRYGFCLGKTRIGDRGDEQRRSFENPVPALCWSDP